ncbi:DUF4159 domain-containing protein [Mangrovibacterium marinum]|uniref:Uncharacterized protein DUF4159 n=1 Tax=Mangrovibacterium marinum TaxID=1639118 RepID=A0A2T5BY67_9BACT|nr:DUF4159 domain-containing protein [Mangrovibacterium marinum]PTN06777.1 uncharacterized protein DUF4159 [Mangrovibacterium marinum]
MKRLFSTLLLMGVLLLTQAQEATLKIGLMKYKGGGDWYGDPTALPNLMRFCNQNLHTKFASDPGIVGPASPELFNYPMVHLTGHGNLIFSPDECRNLKLYFEAGGFLHIDDNYGLDPYIRREMKKIFPDQEFVELPASHPIFHQQFDFPGGLPKIHEHDGKRAQAFGLFIDGRLVCLYTYESDLSDGWEDPAVHGDPAAIRQKALKMGANIVSYVFSN